MCVSGRSCSFIQITDVIFINTLPMNKVNEFIFKEVSLCLCVYPCKTQVTRTHKQKKHNTESTGK